MKKHKKSIIMLGILWIVLIVVTVVNMKEGTFLNRLMEGVLRGAMAFFGSGLIGLAAAAASAVVLHVKDYLEDTDTSKDIYSIIMTSAMGISFAIIYYCLLTNQHLLIKFYGGW